MGHGHGEPFVVPNYTKYNNWQKIPKLVAHQKRLEKIGLSDPWIRNTVHFFNPDNPNWVEKSRFRHALDLIKPGVKPGFIIAASIIAVEEAYLYIRYGHTSWAGHH